MTGMLMFGKISVGVRKAETVPKIRISNAMTMNVYGRRRASRTIPTIAPSHMELRRRHENPDRSAVRARVQRHCGSECFSGAVPGDQSEFRVEFPIRKMHSPYLYMPDVNYNLEFRLLGQACPEVRCDRPQSARGVRCHHEGEIRHAGRTRIGAQPARDEPCYDSIEL